MSVMGGLASLLWAPVSIRKCTAELRLQMLSQTRPFILQCHVADCAAGSASAALRCIDSPPARTAGKSYPVSNQRFARARAGWAAMSMLQSLHADEFNVTIVSPRNYFTFTPLLARPKASRSLRRALLMPQVYPGSLYRSGKSN